MAFRQLIFQNRANRKRSLLSHHRSAKPLTFEPLEPRLLLAAAGLTDVGTQPTGALSGKIVYTHGGHGITADNMGSGTWSYQRGITHDIIEDLGNQDQMSFFVDYLFRAGATVVPLRPVGHQLNEVVLDNVDSEVTFTGAWTDSEASIYFGGAFDVPSLLAPTSAIETATARFQPDLPEAGFYPIYTWTEHGADRANDQLYRVQHSGGITEVTINHRRVGSGLVYLGTYFFAAGSEGYVEISNRSNDLGKVVAADMIRFGNGMGDIERGAGVSGQSREDEAGLYWIQWHVDRAQGIPDTEYRTESSDLSASRPSIPMFAEWMNREEDGELSDRVQVSFHSNAGAGVERGVLGLFNGNNDPATATPNQELLAATLAQEVNDDMVAQDGLFEHFWHDRTVVTLDRSDLEFSEINNQSTGGEFDATIIETAFHDNLLDAHLMRDPNVRDALARATYQGLVNYFSQVDGGVTQIVAAPASVTAVQAEAAGSGSVTVSWAPPAADSYRGDPATGYRIYGSTNGYGFDGGTYVADGNSSSYTFTGLDLNEGAYYYQVVAVNGGGESPGSEVVAAIPKNGTKEILIVNGFDRLDREQNPLQTTSIGSIERVRPRQSNARNYAVQVASDLEQLTSELSVDTTSNEGVISGAISLEDYQAVIWILGEESAADDTFASTEQTKVTNFLAAGGNLFVSGSEIGWDLDFLNNGRGFYNHQLHADFLSNDAETYQVLGTAGGIFEGLSFSFDNGSHNYDSESPDEILPIMGATSVFEYESGETAAIHYDGGTGQSQVVMLAFPFETITNSSLRTQTLGRVLEQFGFPINPTPYELILDNDDDISIYFESGSWSTAGDTGYDGTSYRFAFAEAMSTARWTFSVPTASQGEIFVQYRASGNRTSNTAYRIDTGNGVEHVSINQQINDLTWVSLGIHDFTAGSHTVVLDASASTGGIILVADAVRIAVTPTVPSTGDFDSDTDVDGIDFLTWQRGFGITMGASRTEGDSDADGDVDPVDLNHWQAQFGTATATVNATNFSLQMAVANGQSVEADLPVLAGVLDAVARRSSLIDRPLVLRNQAQHRERQLKASDHVHALDLHSHHHPAQSDLRWHAPQLLHQLPLSEADHFGTNGHSRRNDGYPQTTVDNQSRETFFCQLGEYPILPQRLGRKA